MKIVHESPPTRCEICHKADLFDANTGTCSRCQELSLPTPIVKVPGFLTNPPPTRRLHFVEVFLWLAFTPSMIIFLQAAIGGTIRVTPLLTALICGYYLFNNNNLQPNRLPTTNAPTNATTPSTSTLTSSLESLINRESPLAQILVNVSLVLAIMFSWPILTFFIPSLAGWLTGPLPILPIIGAIIFYLSYTQQQRRRATTNSAPPPTLHSGVSAPSPEQALNPTTALPNNAALPQPSNRSEYSLESQDVTIIPSIPRPSESTAAAAVISSLADNSNINNNSDPINLTNNPPTTSLNAPLPRKRTLQ